MGARSSLDRVAARLRFSVFPLAIIALLMTMTIVGSLRRTDQGDLTAATELDPPGTAERSALAQQVELTTVAGDADDIEMLEWAMARMSTLSGSLPPLVVDFQPANDCYGNNAYYTQPASRIDFCNHGDAGLEPRQTMLHELAHAWSFRNMSGHTIDAFLELRGLEEWTPDEVAWWQSGQEQVAEILAWGLMGDRPYSSKWTRFEPCHELVAAFVLITGRSPDRPSTACLVEQPDSLKCVREAHTRRC